jgi:hypothetical protein
MPMLGVAVPAVSALLAGAHALLGEDSRTAEDDGLTCGTTAE